MEEVPQEKKRRSRKVGSRQDVYAGLAERTAGGLRKEDLIKNEKTGGICTPKEIERGRQLAKYMREKREKDKDAAATAAAEPPAEGDVLLLPDES